MSRIAKAFIIIPFNIKLILNEQDISIKGKNGEISCIIHNDIKIEYINNKLKFIPKISNSKSWALVGTMCALLKNMIIGVTNGFSKKLQLIGVGYRVTVKDNTLILSLGFSHCINYVLPSNIVAECLTHTEIILKSNNKQIIGQVAADICSYRFPEPYKGKGICDSDKVYRTKEAKKK